MDLESAVAASEAALAHIFGPSTRRFITELVLEAALPHLVALPTQERAA